MEIRYTTFSEAGVRRANQDLYRIVKIPEHERSLFIVCDGMGGHPMGDVAAETICNTICNFWKENAEYNDSEEKVIEACAKATDALYKRSRIVRPIEMGTTLVMASIERERAIIAHCGDSRCYVFREGKTLHQTCDHSDPGKGSELVTRCFFSMAPEVAVPDIVCIELKAGDRIFLCSDGVYKAMAPEILATRLQDDKPLEEILDVIKFMCEKFSNDNYTAILIEVK